MSSAIKPPGSGPVGGTGVPAEVGGAKSVQGGDPGAFRAELEKAQAVDKAQVPAPAATDRAAALREIAAELRAGRIDARQAVDRLVERTLGTQVVASLPPARRAELEALLRSALAEDPTLAAMQRDLARGR